MKRAISGSRQSSVRRSASVSRHGRSAVGPPSSGSPGITIRRLVGLTARDDPPGAGRAWPRRPRRPAARASAPPPAAPPAARSPRRPNSAAKSANAHARGDRPAAGPGRRAPSRWASSAATSSSMPRGGDTEETATTDVAVLPSERSAARRSACARCAVRPRSALVTTSTSGISMIPDSRNCRTSPDPGWTTTATVSATSAISVSDCPTPTVSTTMTSNATARAAAAARVAGASPPRRSPAAVERMKTASSRAGRARSARGRRAAPPPDRRELGVDGEDRDRATRPYARRRPGARAATTYRPRVAPVTPTIAPGASSPRTVGETAASSAAAWARAAGVVVSTRLRTSAAAPPVAGAQSPGELRPDALLAQAAAALRSL